MSYLQLPSIGAKGLYEGVKAWVIANGDDFLKKYIYSNPDIFTELAQTVPLVYAPSHLGATCLEESPAPPFTPPPIPRRDIHLSDSNWPKPESLPFTVEFQRLLYEHQHPSRCDDKKFLVYTHRRPWGLFGMLAGGVGSEMHAVAQGLYLALLTNRIFIYHPEPWIWGHSWRCRRSNYSPDCFFLPLTNCCITDAQANSSFAPRQNIDPYPADKQFVVWNEWLANPQWPSLQGSPPWNQYFAQPFADELWVKAQLLYYVTRPNAMLRSFVDELAASVYGEGGRPNCVVAMHVRRTDKHIESGEADFELYIRAADDFRRKHAHLAQCSDILLMTDDSELVALLQTPSLWQEFRRNHSLGEWRFHIPDEPRITPWLSRLLSIMNHFPHAYLRLTRGAFDVVKWHFGQLYLLGQEGDAYVFTSTANGCRIINKLRAITGRFNVPTHELIPRYI